MPLSITQVDAFTDRPFAGNPAAVCILPGPAEAVWMQQVAAEMNLAETAFLVARVAGGYDLRWFTPTVEVDLCGHATLAAAHVLWEAGWLPRSSRAEFTTRSGLLVATLGAEGWISLDFPADPVVTAVAPERSSVPVPPAAVIAAAVGVDPAAIVATCMGQADLLVEVASAADVRAAQPDSGLLARIETRGVVVTSRSDPATVPASDFTLRWFGPRVGVPEDPVTGSAHCLLGPYWGPRLGKTQLVGFQASSRGGFVRVTLAGDRVLLGGQAVTVLRGELVGAANPA